MESAYDWGKRHKSCTEALRQRKALGLDVSQKDWYECFCERGTWLFWQFEQLPMATQEKLKPKILRALYFTLRRHIEHLEETTRSPRVLAWAQGWLGGVDRVAADAMAIEKTIPCDNAARDIIRAAMRLHCLHACWNTKELLATARSLQLSLVFSLHKQTEQVEERLLQAEDIRRAIPKWPGDDEC